MNCLHLCLKSGGKKIYCVKKNNKILGCDKNDVIEIFGDTVHVGGEREKFEKIIDKYSLEDLKDSFKINLQARRVILVAESLRR